MSKKSILKLTLFVSCLWLAVGPVFTAESTTAEAGFILVVAASNPLDEIPRERVTKIFLKRVREWSDGERIVPVDQDVKSPVRQAFSLAVHGRKASAIQRYWQRMIFSGRSSPPAELASDRDVLNHVAGHAGGIGYVTPSTSLGSGVKILPIVDP